MEQSIFVRKLVKILNDRGIKRKTLAEACGFSPQSIVDWDKRSTIQAGDVVYRIAKYLHVSMDWLLNDNTFLYSPDVDEGYDYSCNASEIMYRIDNTIRYQKRDYSYKGDTAFYSNILDIISLDEIYSYKNNFANFPTNIGIKIAQRLAVSFAWLLTGNDPNLNDNNEPFVVGLAAQYSDHLKYLHSMRKKNRLIVMNITKELFHSERQLREELQAKGIDLSTTTMMNTNEE